MMHLNLANHPCFNDKVRHRYGRVHVPVAPYCNIQCNYCNRKFDCANENRPGVSSGILSPNQALYYLKKIFENEPNLSVVGIAGPGDAFASPNETLETLRLVRKQFPDILLCVATNGLNLLPYVDELASYQTSHVTITVNCVDPEVGSSIYSWVRDGKIIYRKLEASRLLIDRQLAAIQALKEKGILVKINTILIPGYNDRHIDDIAKTVRQAGADIMNCIPLYPVADTPFESLHPPTSREIVAVRAACGKHVLQMNHCTRCRADAVGKLGENPSEKIRTALEESIKMPINPEEERPYIAVASREGLLVNLHLGEAQKILIYGKIDSLYKIVETRFAPQPGGGEERWIQLSYLLHDCKALLVHSAGKNPCTTLERHGIKVVMMEGLIEEGLLAIDQGLEIRSPMRREHQCGSGCAGTGTGCM